MSQCFICFEDIGACNSIVLPCGHGTHFDCGMKWYATKTTCPCCRASTGHEVLEPAKVTSDILREHMARYYNTSLIQFIESDEYHLVHATTTITKTQLIVHLVKDRWLSLVILKIPLPRYKDRSNKSLRDFWRCLPQKIKTDYYTRGLSMIVSNVQIQSVRNALQRIII
jgi:hypothetical protein